MNSTFNPEDEGSMLLRNNGTTIQNIAVYTDITMKISNPVHF
jgi:hypothetical protein